MTSDCPARFVFVWWRRAVSAECRLKAGMTEENTPAKDHRAVYDALGSTGAMK